MRLHDYTLYWYIYLYCRLHICGWGVVGLILTACLTAGRNKDDDDIDQYP